MTKQEFLSKQTSGLYTNTDCFNSAYSLRGLIMRSIENIRDADASINDFIVSNGLTSFNYVIVLDDRVVIHKEGLELALNFDYECLDRFCFVKPIKSYVPFTKQVEEVYDDFWDSI